MGMGMPGDGDGVVGHLVSKIYVFNQTSINHVKKHEKALTSIVSGTWTP